MGLPQMERPRRELRDLLVGTKNETVAELIPLYGSYSEDSGAL